MNALPESVWVHTDSWAGRMKHPGELLQRNPKRSLVRYDYCGSIVEKLVPNYAITKRSEEQRCKESQ